MLPEKPSGRLRIYAYSIAGRDHTGLLKIGQTTRSAKQRISEQLRTAAITNYRIELDEPAERLDGSVFSDHEVRSLLRSKGHANPAGEWIRCTTAELKEALAEIKEGVKVEGNRSETFELRDEQEAAIQKTLGYFKSIWNENSSPAPRFLWNAKMRFGKTFTAYHLAKRMEAKRVLVVTFKPAVADAWQTDLLSHRAFAGWSYLSKTTRENPSQFPADSPLVYFGSFQDLLGKDASGNIKPKNRWLHKINWDIVIFDEYHFGAWREKSKSLFENEEDSIARAEDLIDNNDQEVNHIADLQQPMPAEQDFLPIIARAYLYLSGTPFKALSTGEFIEEQIFHWTYTDEQKAKNDFLLAFPDRHNPYAALPEMRLLTYQMPDELISIASGGEFNEFDLNTFFEANGEGEDARFTHVDDCQKWLDIIRGEYLPSISTHLKIGTKPPFPYSDTRLRPYLEHSLWFLPNVASCFAMANLLRARHNHFWQQYKVIVVAGKETGNGLDALPPVREAIGSGFDSKTITLTCGKLTTGVTVQQWSSILMLRNLKSPETYFQSAFRVQSPWTIRNPNGDDPNAEEILKPVCFIFDFAPIRALRQVSEYAIRLAPDEPNPEKAVADLVNFLPVLAYDGANMVELKAAGILDFAQAGTAATLLARKWESPLLVNVDDITLKRVLNNPEAMAALKNIEGWRKLGANIIEAIINHSDKVKELRKKAQGAPLTQREKQRLSDEEKEYKSKRKLVQEKLIKFATSIPPFMYLTDFRENTLQDVITKLEPDLFEMVTGLTVKDFDLLVSLRVFNTDQMNQAVRAFRRYENASLNYTGIDSHEGLRNEGLWDTVTAKE